MDPRSTQSATGVEGFRVAEFKGEFAHPEKLPRVNRDPLGCWSWNHPLKGGRVLSGQAASKRLACQARRLAVSGA